MSSKGKRYSSEFKKQVVEQALSEGHTIAGTARDYGIGDQILRNWIQDSRDSKCPDKVRIAQLEEELRAMLPPNNQSLSQIQKETGIPEGTLKKWRMGIRDKGFAAPAGE